MSDSPVWNEDWMKTQQNGFLNGGIEIGGWEVDQKNISCPLLNIYALSALC